MRPIQALKDWNRQRMFKKISIHMTGPICTCEEQNLAWSTPNDGLCIECSTCKTKLIIPREKFRAGFDLERAYPGKKVQKLAPVLHLVKDVESDV